MRRKFDGSDVFGLDVEFNSSHLMQGCNMTPNSGVVDFISKENYGGAYKSDYFNADFENKKRKTSETTPNTALYYK